jgi:Lrp/AsnC family transcriptional regulator, regulator for asnA, asnC and gidA
MIDELDKQIINMSLTPGKQSSKKLASKLGVSSATVRRRIQRLYKQGILRTVVVTEASELGYSTKVFIGLDVVPQKVSAVMKQLSNQTEIKTISTTSGRFDIMAIAWFRSNDELSDFMENTILKLDGVRDTETFISLNFVKRQGLD